MKGIRFYQEFTDKRAKRRNEPNGNVVAVFFENTWLENRPNNTLRRLFECLSATFFEPNSPVSGSSVSQGYLTENCKRIGEQKAREIHPELFIRLDMPD